MQTKIWKMLSSLFLESTNSQILQMSPFFIKHFFGKRVIFQNDVFCWNKQSDWGTRFWGKKILKLLLFFLLDVNFENLIVELYVLIISSMIANFQEDQRSIVILSIKYLNFKFFSLKLCIKNKFIDIIVNNIRFE